jgi:predicted alpha/beta superfamily hydrolase
MKRFLCTFSLIALIVHGKAQTDNRIIIGKIDSIQSTILNEKRKIWVYVPGGGALDIYSKQRYPVVYLLDGDGHFSSVVGMIQQLSTVNGNMICPEMIVVGITNTDRTRDLTPTHIDVDPPYMDSASAKTSGGGEKFISFIEKELMPYIESNYPTEPYKMLVGHSFGGLIVMQTFVHHTNLFNSFICIDPSMWWDKQNLLKESKNILINNKFEGTSLFLGIANTMPDGMNINKVSNDTSAETRHIRSILKLRSYFEQNKQNSLKFQSKYYNDDSHGSVPLITEYDALHFLFEFYPLKMTFKDFTDTTTALLDKYVKHFSTVSKKMGYKVKPSEEQINSFGYEALGSKHYKKAAGFFKYNIDNYPESFNVYDSMGDYYEAVGDKLNAIKYFEKALSIKENTDTRKKLEKIKS